MLQIKRKIYLVGIVCLLLAALFFVCQLPAPLVFADLRDAAETDIRVQIDRIDTDQPILFTITDTETADAIVEALSALKLTPLAPSQTVTYGKTGIIDLWIGETHLRFNDLGDVHSDTVRFYASPKKLSALIEQINAAQP